jgi:hypothetical protein
LAGLALTSFLHLTAAVSSACEQAPEKREARDGFGSW